MNQITDTILMVRPVAFRMNEETAVNNYFQKNLKGKDVNKEAQAEFDTFVKKLWTSTKYSISPMALIKS